MIEIIHESITKISWSRRRRFEQVLDELVDNETGRIKVLAPGVPDQFLKVVWKGSAGILLQNEEDKEFFAIDNLYSIIAFQLSFESEQFKPFVLYTLK